MDKSEEDEELNRFRSFKEASAALKLPYFKIQRAAKNGLIPTYSILNNRKYVKLSDILERMSATQN